MPDLSGKQKAAARKRRQRRVRAKVVGTAARPRLNVFRSLAHIYAQVIDDEAGLTLVSASTVDRELAGQVEALNKREAARLVGQMVAQRAQQAGIESVVFDRAGFRYMGRVAALAEAARAAGLKF